MSLNDVKELRERSGAGMLDCKKALDEAKGDIEKAIDILRKTGAAKAQKKQSRIAAEGITTIVEKGNKAIIIEVNSETDFVAKNEKFQEFVNNIANTILDSDVEEMDEALKLKYNDETIEDYIMSMTAVIGEKLSFRRFKVLEKDDDEVFGNYVHAGGRISTLLVLEDGDEELAKNMAMQVTAMNPKYLDIKSVDKDVLERERSVIKEQVERENEGKNLKDEIKEKIIDGKVHKFYKDIVLLEQAYIDDNKKSVKDILDEADAEIEEYVRYEVGEGLEKKSCDFAAEVMEQMK